MKTNHSHSGCRRVLALLLTVLTVMSMLPSAAFAAQPTTYRDPAEHWMNAGSRTNELDINAVVSHETFYCHSCKQYTSFTIWRTPEYTCDGQTALTRNVLYSDGTMVDGEGTGSILDGDPGIDAFYTGYHWTKSMCDNCGVINANGGATHYGYSKNVYNLYDCASGFSEDLKDVVTYEYADDTYHTKTVEGGHYCEFCFGTVHTHSSTLERHNLKTEVKAQLDKQRFAVVTSCSDCDYTKTEYVAAKSVVADYYGAVDGQAHTLTVSDLSESGVTAKIRYGNSGEATVGEYLVIVTDTSSGKPITNAAVELNKDGTISVRFPDGRLLDYGNHTTVYVLKSEDKSPVKGVQIYVTDVKGNYVPDVTDKNGQITIPDESGDTGDKGSITFGGKDADNDLYTVTVNVVDGRNNRPIDGAEVSIGKTGTITVVLPDGLDMDEKNPIIITVTDQKGRPLDNVTVIVKGDKDKETGKTGEDGTLTLPEVTVIEKHGAYIYGYPDGTFGPSRSMTRSEVTAIFARLLAERKGDTIPETARTKFTDIPANAWYSGYVRYLTGYGIVTGSGDNKFSPNAEITRAEVVAMAVRFFEVYDGGNAAIMEQYAEFNDVSEGYWAAEYIKDAAIHGWIKGYGDGTFRATANITRAEAVTIINRLLGRVADEDYIDANLRRLTTFTDMDPKHWAYYEVMESANAHTADVTKGESWMK